MFDKWSVFGEHLLISRDDVYKSNVTPVQDTNVCVLSRESFISVVGDVQLEDPDSVGDEVHPYEEPD